MKIKTIFLGVLANFTTFLKTKLVRSEISLCYHTDESVIPQTSQFYFYSYGIIGVIVHGHVIKPFITISAISVSVHIVATVFCTYAEYGASISIQCGPLFRCTFDYWEYWDHCLYLSIWIFRVINKSPNQEDIDRWLSSYFNIFPVWTFACQFFMQLFPLLMFFFTVNL